MSYQQSLLREVRRMIDETLKRWNPWTGSTTIGELPQSALPPPERSPYAPAGAAFDAHKFWGRPIADAAPADGDAYLWDEASSMFILGAAAGGGTETVAAAFRAQLAADTVLNGAYPMLPMNTEHYDSGDLYDHTHSIWSPPPGPVIFVFRARFNVTTQTVVVGLFKNGGEIYRRTGGTYTFLGDGWMEAAYQDMAAPGDYYQIGAYAAPGSVLASDTWWSGMTGGGGGGGAGTGTGDGLSTIIPADSYHPAGTVHQLLDMLFSQVAGIGGLQDVGFGFGGFGVNAFGA